MLFAEVVEISSWPKYSFDGFEFFFSHLVPILLTGLFTVMITYKYDKILNKSRDYKTNVDLLFSQSFQYDQILHDQIFLYAYADSIGDSTSDQLKQFVVSMQTIRNTTIMINATLNFLAKTCPKKTRSAIESLKNDYKSIFDKVSLINSDIINAHEENNLGKVKSLSIELSKIDLGIVLASMYSTFYK